MYAKSSESDLASLSPSSPRSPKRPVIYFVQSPSRDSHDDGDKSAVSSSSLPNTTPIDSPSHPNYYSRASSASRVSGTYALASSSSASSSSSRKKLLPHKIRRSAGGGGGHCHVILEEGDFVGGAVDPTKCRVLLVVMGFAAVFTAFCFVIWGASRPFRPHILVKSLTVHNFYFGQGSDLTGVPTKMLTTNCSVGIKVYNPASFFGIRITSTPLHLMFSELIVATGQLRSYYQPRNSHRAVSVNINGMKVPLYGAGASLTRSAGEEVRIPVTLVFQVRSKGYVVGKLVKSWHTQRISCALVFDPRRTKPVPLKKRSCTYKLI
ncbi:hypothetical protein LINGRAHAP2_LOCUS21488 [Linum grandiflorum]